jgi:hypothetical protein
MSSFTHPVRHGITGPVLTVVAAGTALVLLADCGNSGNGIRDEGVASIVTPSTTAGKTADRDTGHGRIRLDDDLQDVNRLGKAWTDCLHDHGVPADRKPANSPALKACGSKHPLQPVETDPAMNPRYGDGVRAMVKCMNGHGIKSVVCEGNWGPVKSFGDNS